MTLSIIIPVFNERHTIAAVLTRVEKTKIPIQKEIIVVDDGSTDGTREVLETLLKKKSSFSLLKHPTNQGKGAAIRTGGKFATGDIFLIQDADLEYNPLEYGKLLAPILSGKTQVVYGSRFLGYKLRLFGPEKTPMLHHYVGNKLLTLLTNFLFGNTVTDMETGYKVFTKEVYDSLSLSASRFDVEPEITARILLAGFSIYEVPISFSPRGYSEGKKITWRDGVHALRTLLTCRFTREK